MEAKNIVKISNTDEKFCIRFKPDPIYFRVSVYTLTLAMHFINAVVMILGFRGDAMNDLDVRTYYRFQYRFITCWTFVVQMIYAALGLYCDCATLKKEESSKLKMLKIGREIIFSGLVVPTSFMVSTAFWALFLYDRNLILPISMNKAISALSNHIVHTLIIPIAVWEMIFLPRTVPNAHWINLLILMIFCIVYTTVLILTYFEMGMWPYPVMNLLEGTIYFHMFVWSCIGLLPFYYCLQWFPTRLLWSESRLARVKAD